jgi:hypothetical protein
MVGTEIQADAVKQLMGYHWLAVWLIHNVRMVVVPQMGSMALCKKRGG